MKIKETRKLSYNGLLKVCINEQWYTRGTNEEYNAMLEMADSINESITENHLFKIAANICAHSEFDAAYDGCSENARIESIMFVLAKACNSHFEIIA